MFIYAYMSYYIFLKNSLASLTNFRGKKALINAHSIEKIGILYTTCCIHVYNLPQLPHLRITCIWRFTVERSRNRL